MPPVADAALQRPKLAGEEHAGVFPAEPVEEFLRGPMRLGLQPLDDPGPARLEETPATTETGGIDRARRVALPVIRTTRGTPQRCPSTPRGKLGHFAGFARGSDEEIVENRVDAGRIDGSLGHGH